MGSRTIIQTSVSHTLFLSRDVYQSHEACPYTSNAIYAVGLWVNWDISMNKNVLYEKCIKYNY